MYFFRHAPGELRHQFALTGQPDEQRPLTPRGIQRQKKMMEYFRKIENSVDVFLTSPFKRCSQTAQICKEFFPKAQVIETENLCPDHSAQKLYQELQSYEVEAMGLVGHEPDLGQFLSWLLFRQATDQFPIKKSGIIKVDFYRDKPTYLKWMLPPKLACISHKD